MKASLKPIVTLVAMAALISTGCTQTPNSIKQATDLAKSLTAYQEQQKDRVDRFNSDYRERFNELMDDLVSLSDRQLSLDRDSDAQNLADALTSDDNSSLIGKLRKSFSDAMEKQREAISAADQSITASRAAYVKQYTDAALELGKLDKVEKDLTNLASRETLVQELENAQAIIQNVVATHEQIMKQQQASANTKATAASKKPSTSGSQ